MEQAGRKIEVKQIIPPLVTLGVLGVGLSLFCDPSKVQGLLPLPTRNTFGHLLAQSNEQEEVKEILDSIPDGEEREVAGLINGAVMVNRRKGHKPHLNILKALRAASDIYSSGRRIK